MVSFHLKPPMSGDGHGVQKMLHTKPPVLARANETTGGASRMAALRGERRGESADEEFAAVCYCAMRLVSRLDAAVAGVSTEGSLSVIDHALPTANHCTVPKQDTLVAALVERQLEIQSHIAMHGDLHRGRARLGRLIARVLQ